MGGWECPGAMEVGGGGVVTNVYGVGGGVWGDHYSPFLPKPFSG